ncbi:phospholipid:lipid A palmitoyltransferase [Pandoraea terrae]|uniref:Phospholipid:lipid A palmitoyltransferase n=2 Tax=Pandoraea terrae TaxID=1537710 RepID=A0A5E4RVH6_9BURK|nr:phospholipid:lipid A palmitoyltransferase [Pandoraea terrae]
MLGTGVLLNSAAWAQAFGNDKQGRDVGTMEAVGTSITHRDAQDTRSLPGRWAEAVRHEVSDIWTHGAADLYVPLHTHHLRFAYSREKVDQYNEHPWGIGFGRALPDGNGGTRVLYAMVFRDSHSHWSPMAGYGRIWRLASVGPVDLGLGYSVFLMSRSDTMSGVPFPGALPLAAATVGRFSLTTTYVPGGKGYGNILFLFGRYTFGDVR